MNREDRKKRDAEVITEYTAGRGIEYITTKHDISVPGLFVILRRWGVRRNIKRRPNKVKEVVANMRPDADAVVLVARGACKTIATAQQWLKRADFLDKHPESPFVELKHIGATKGRVLSATNDLLRIKATLSAVAPFKVMFTEKMRYLPLTHRQYIVFLAHPYFYLMEHKDEIRSVPL